MSIQSRIVVSAIALWFAQGWYLNARLNHVTILIKFSMNSDKILMMMSLRRSTMRAQTPNNITASAPPSRAP
jgi:hypothetical protein